MHAQCSSRWVNWLQLAAAITCVANSHAAAQPSTSDNAVTIAGRVFDELGQPLAGIEVEAFARKHRPTTRSDPNGRFSLQISKDHRGSLALRAKSDDASRQGFYLFDKIDASAPSAKLVMRPARTVEINVIDAEQRPIEGALAAAMTYWYDTMSQATSDRTGHALLRVPADAGLQYVWAMKPDVGLDYFAFRRFDEPASNVYKLPPDYKQPLALVLDGTRTVTVRVVDEKGRPMKGVKVTPWYVETPQKGDHLNIGGVDEFYVATDADGRAAFPYIPADVVNQIIFWARPDDYYTPERPVFDPQGESSEITARLVSLVPVRGRVTLFGGRPAANVEVCVNGDGYEIDRFRQSTRTAADGSFEIRVYPDQHHVFSADLDRLSALPVTRVVRQGQSPDDVQLVLQPAARIYGKLTAGDDHQPVPEQHLTLYQSYAEQYHTLPPEERLPNPQASNKAVGPLLGRNAQTDADGGFEFFVPPGHYYIVGPQTLEVPKFDVSDQTEREINLHAERIERVVLVGSVVLDSDPTKAVSEAHVFGVPGYVRAVTDADGAFEVERPPLEMLFHAQSKDAALAGIRRVGAGDRSCEILVAETTRARGRVVHAATGQPLAEQQIIFGLRFDEPGGAFSYHFGGTATTGTRGEFLLEGLVPGWKYAVNLVLGRDRQGIPRRFSTAASITPRHGEIAELGDFKLTPAAVPATVAGKLTVDGTLLAKGKILFHPDKGKPVEAEVKDGAFSTDKVPVGEMKVTFEFEGVPKKYQSAQTTPLRATITEGKNQLAFEIATN